MPLLGYEVSDDYLFFIDKRTEVVYVFAPVRFCCSYLLFDANSSCL